MILGMDECAVRDTHNVVSSNEFYECIAIIVCQMGENIFALQPKCPDITKASLATFRIGVVGADHPLAIPTKSKRSAEFIGYLMNLRGR